jgi:hypothetical protein
VGEIGAHPLHPRQGIADRGGERRLRGDADELLGEPGFKLIKHRDGLGLAEVHPALGRGAAGLLLDGVEPGDALDGFLGDRRGL